MIQPSTNNYTIQIGTLTFHGIYAAVANIATWTPIQYKEAILPA